MDSRDSVDSRDSRDSVDRRDSVDSKDSRDSVDYLAIWPPGCAGGAYLCSNWPPADAGGSDKSRDACSRSGCRWSVFVGHFVDEFAAGGDLIVSDVTSVDRAAVERDAADIDIGGRLTAGLDR